MNINDMRLACFSIIPALIGSWWTFGIIFGAGLQIDAVTIIVPIFVVVMGSADGLHFVMHFQEEVSRTEDKMERVHSTLQQIGIPLILTTISTAAGFLSLCFTAVRPIQLMGAFSAMGIVFAGVVSFFFLPALMSSIVISPNHYHQKSLHTEQKTLEKVDLEGNDKNSSQTASTNKSAGKLNHIFASANKVMTKGLQSLAQQKYIAALLSIGVVVFSSFYIPQIEVNTDQLFFFKLDHPIRTNFALTQEIFVVVPHR